MTIRIVGNALTLSVQYGLKLPEVYCPVIAEHTVISSSLMGQIAGRTYHDYKVIEISSILFEAGHEVQRNSIFAHEIGHIIAGYEAGHGAVWEAWVRKLGHVPEQYHSYTPILSNRKIQTPIVAYCYSCGIPIYGNRAITSSDAFVCRKCGKPLIPVD